VFLAKNKLKELHSVALKKTLVTTAVCRKSSLSTQHIKPWSRWATAAEDTPGVTPVS